MRKILFIDDEANIANNLQWNLEHSGNFDVIFLQDYRQIDIEIRWDYIRRYDAYFRKLFFRRRKSKY